MAKTEQKVFSSSAAADALYSELVDQVSSAFDTVETDYDRKVASFQRRFEFPGEWTDITMLEITIEVVDSGRGSTVHFASHVQTNNMMNNTPWQVSNFMGDCAKAIESTARSAIANY